MSLKTIFPTEGSVLRHMLGKGKARLVFGGSLLLTPRRAKDLAVVEDISIGHSPDVSFHASFNARF
jgi:hypothetical protein